MLRQHFFVGSYHRFALSERLCHNLESLLGIVYQLYNQLNIGIVQELIFIKSEIIGRQASLLTFLFDTNFCYFSLEMLVLMDDVVKPLPYASKSEQAYFKILTHYDSSY